MADALPQSCLDQLFRSARTFHEWTDKTVGDHLLREIYDLLKWGPTSGNSCPARFVWVRSHEGKATLSSLASESNRETIRTAPVTVIVGSDLDFVKRMPELYPAASRALIEYFRTPGVTEITATRNGTLQGAYLIVAARALGLDCGPMSGFDNEAVDRAFSSETRIKSNFICSLGYGKPNTPFARNPRLRFEDAGRLA